MECIKIKFQQLKLHRETMLQTKQSLQGQKIS